MTIIRLGQFDFNVSRIRECPYGKGQWDLWNSQTYFIFGVQVKDEMYSMTKFGKYIKLKCQRSPEGLQSNGKNFKKYKLRF